MSSEDLERRLRRLENLLNDVVNRLAAIEELLKSVGLKSEEFTTAERLVMTFSLPAVVAIKAAERVIRSIKELGVVDPISRSIIEVLSSCEELSISRITERVRTLRGTASRRIVRERLRKLLRKGVVVNVGTGTRSKYMLKACIKIGGTGERLSSD